MLNDADVPLNGTITPTGAVRTSNLVTITTSTAHGLAIGNIVQIGSVSDTSFNGTQTVFSVPSSTTFTYNQTAANASSGNGTVSLLIQGDVWADAVLVPLVNKAYRKVQRRLEESGSKTTTGEVILALAVGQVALTDSSSPQLPVDFLGPREVWERITGSGANFTPLQPVDVLPSVSQTGYNRVFAWFDESINFIGSTNALDTRLRYIKGLPAISDASSPIAIRGGVDAVATQTAFLAATSRGSPSSQVFGAQFENDIKELLNLQAHARQYLPGRRRPNNLRGRGSYGRYSVL
jgi:hypothetical protein